MLAGRGSWLIDLGRYLVLRKKLDPRNWLSVLGLFYAGILVIDSIKRKQEIVLFPIHPISSLSSDKVGEPDLSCQGVGSLFLIRPSVVWAESGIRMHTCVESIISYSYLGRSRSTRLTLRWYFLWWIHEIVLNSRFFLMRSSSIHDMLPLGRNSSPGKNKVVSGIKAARIRSASVRTCNR